MESTTAAAAAVDKKPFLFGSLHLPGRPTDLLLDKTSAV